MEAQEIIDLYKKRNRVKHCFRAINTLNLASPIYHWTSDKIRVHMFLSYLAYLFLSLIYNEARNIDESISLENVLDRLLSVNIIYMTDGKKEKKIINSNDDIGLKILKGLRLERFS
ncbi:MAG: hypothetical protein ACP5JT_06195 [Thermoplasmata archaeon]